MPIKQMSNAYIGKLYTANKMYDQAATAKYGTITSAPHNGKNIRIQAKPIASVVEYDAWLANGNRRRNKGDRRTGAKLRRIVIMRRQGSSWNECGYAVGVCAQVAARWVEFLPFHLSV